MAKRPKESENKTSLLNQVLQSLDAPNSRSALFPEEGKDFPMALPGGGKIYESTLIAISRILALNPHLHKRGSDVVGRRDELYDGHMQIRLDDKKTLMSLIGAYWDPRDVFQKALVEKYVEKLVPKLTRDEIYVSKGLVWDRKNAVLKQVSEDPEDSEDPIFTIS